MNIRRVNAKRITKNMIFTVIKEDEDVYSVNLIDGNDVYRNNQLYTEFGADVYVSRSKLVGYVDIDTYTKIED